jgi:hypothetical protein
VTVAPAAEVASAVKSLGSVSVGRVVSWISTANVVDAELPRVSAAVQVTVVEPNANVDPDGGVQVTGRDPSTMSVAVGLVNVTIAPLPLVASTVGLPGVPAMVGGVRSRIVTVNVLVPVLPAVSVAEQVTVVVPIANAEPDAGLQVTVGLAGAASVAEAVNVTTRPFGPVASRRMGAGTLTTGGVRSQAMTFAVTVSVVVVVRLLAFDALGPTAE